MNRINLICLGVRNLKKSLAFYKNIGFKTPETALDPPIVFFDTQGTKLELYPLEQLAEDINQESPPKLNADAFNGITFAINMKSKGEVDVFMQTVKQHGGTIAKEPADVFWGGYSGYFQDLDGYYWEVAYADSWEFDANNMLVIE